MRVQAAVHASQLSACCVQHDMRAEAGGEAAREKGAAGYQAAAQGRPRGEGEAEDAQRLDEGGADGI